MLTSLLVACAVLHPCVEPLERWCWLPEEEIGPVCDTSTADDVPLESRCGNFDVASSGGGFSGTTWYFSAETGVLVAAEAWTDASNGVCGTLSSFGRCVACDTECTYGDTMATFPSCD